MADAQRHIIHKQRLEIHLAGKKGAKEYQDELSRTFRKAIVPLYQQLFDKAVRDHEVLRLDRVELDLGRIDPRHLGEELPRLLRRHLEDALARHVHQARLCNELLTDKPSASTKLLPEQPQATGRPADEEVLTFYLKYGRLPWHTTPADYPDMKAMCLQFAEHYPDLLMQVLREKAHREKVAGRLSYSLPEEVIIRLLVKQAGVPEHDKIVGSLGMLFRKLIREGVSLRTARTYLWKQAFITLGRHRGLSLWKFVSEWFYQSYRQLPTGWAVVSFLPLSLSQVQFFYTILKKPVWKTLTAGLPATVSTSCQELLQSIVQEKATGNESTMMPDEANSRNESFSQNRTKDQKELETGVSIENAGLVILWPYLVHLFRGLGYVEGESFKDTDRAERAVMLLHYLATGSESCEESELFFNKLLCGLDPDAPVDTGIELTEQEREEAVNLLDFTGKQWTALKGIRPEGLRDSFIRREGMVYLAPKGWKVLIERTAFDLLIDKLPWSVSMIRLPWNEYYITVEW